MNILLDTWATTMWRACWQGGLVVLVVWSIWRLIPSMTAMKQIGRASVRIVVISVIMLGAALVGLSAEIERVGTKVTADKDRPSGPVIEADSNSQVMRTKLKSLRQQVLEADVIVVGVFLDSAPANPNRAGDAPESLWRFRVVRFLSGKLDQKVIAIRHPDTEGAGINEIAGKEWILLLSPDYIAGKHPYAGLYNIKVESEIGAVLAAGRDKLRGQIETTTDQAKAIAEIKKLGGKVKVDETSPDKPVVGVWMRDTTSTDAGLKWLKGLRSLQSLDLATSKVTDAGLKNVEQLTNLRSLSLASTSVTDAGLSHLKGLTNLQSLVLSRSQVTNTGLGYLKGLTKLDLLDLLGTQVTDAGLEQLKGLIGLRSLELEMTQVTDAGLKPSNLPSLRSLDVGFTKVTDAGLRDLKDFAMLQRLALWNTRITDAGLKECEGLGKLQWLSLGGTQVTDAGLENLSKLTNLQELILSDTKVTDAGVKNLQRALPNCKIQH